MVTDAVMPILVFITAFNNFTSNTSTISSYHKRRKLLLVKLRNVSKKISQKFVGKCSTATNVNKIHNMSLERE